MKTSLKSIVEKLKCEKIHISPETIMRMHEEAKKIIRESRRKQAASEEAAKHIYLD